MRQRIVRSRYHLHLPGLMFVGVTLLIGLGAFNSDNNLLYLVFAIALASIPVSGIISAAMMMGLEVRREAIAHAGVGVPLMVRYRVTNHRRFVPAFAMTITELEHTARRARPATWHKCLPAPLAYLAHIGPRETVHSEANLVPFGRGEAHLDRISVMTRFPFGIVRKSVVFSQPQTVIVQPRVVPLRRDLLAEIANRSESGLTSSATRGRGDEFYAIREYRPGDSRRLIAWKPTARTGSLVVRENTDPASRRLWVVLDLPLRVFGAADEQRRQAEDAISLAASAVCEAIDRGIEVGLSVPAFELTRTPAKLYRHRVGLLDALGAINLEARRDVTDDGAALASSVIGPRVAYVVVHVDQMDPTVGPPSARHLVAGDLGALAAEPIEQEAAG